MTPLNALAFVVLALSLCSPSSPRDGRCACVERYPPPTPAQLRSGVQEAVNSAVAVFVGEVVTRESLVVVLKVDRVWKGAIGKTVRMQVVAPRPDGLIEGIQYPTGISMPGRNHDCSETDASMYSRPSETCGHP